MKFKKHFLIILFITYQINAQKDASTDGIELNLRPQFSAIFVPVQDYYSGILPDYEIGNNSMIYGREISASVNFIYFGVGAGIGTETLHLKNEKIDYFPVYLELTPFPSKNPKNGFASFSGRIGTHFGNLDRNGFYSRIEIGYYIPIFNHFSLFIKGIYTHQRLYKAFPESHEPVNVYTFDGAGFGFGIEIY
ncbi:hypothetical protein [Autumnicola psychrophila]|uniref:Outer membrane protein beta-barrel domain-containing protein n=1 Tax=Autumnicola psychrophila TaxID=3075592 RepID=A0ABU3DME4_9FLAO|nr:hypothetical protein [Zunongwangia sp. F225]MDT0684890.1 hypothetical protein [Zunongwangia sp. F225]